MIRQAMSPQPFGQAQQSPERHARLGFLRQLTASGWIEHPARHCDLEPLRQLNDIDLVDQSPKHSNDCYLCSEKRMVSVLDLF